MTRNSTIGRWVGFAVSRDIIHRDDTRFASPPMSLRGDETVVSAMMPRGVTDGAMFA